MRVVDILQSPWAIIPARLEEITNIYSTHLRGEKIDIKGVEARIGEPLARQEQGYEVVDGVAIVPIDGVISKKMNLFSQISGGVSTQLIERDFRAALEDPDVHSIILHADTPGGSVDGTAELGQTIFEARGIKPIVTLADGLMASAGVWIGSAADQVFMSALTAEVGSIGVVTQHVDYSDRNKQIGIKVTEIYAGKYKRIASQEAPLSEEGRAYIQDTLDYLYSIFVDTVAKHRGTTPEAVLENMADGRMFVGQQAIDAGLVDGVATLDQLINDLNATRGQLDTVAARAMEFRSSGESDENNGGVVVVEDCAIATSEGSGDDVSEATNEDLEMNLNELKEKHPETAAEARQEGIDESRDAAMSEGATAERDRIQAVLDQSMPGHEALVQKLAFDGKTTGPEAAIAVLKAEKDVRAAAKLARASDAAELDDVDAGVDLDDGSKPPKSSLTPEETMKAEWESDANLRAEFSNDFDRYAAFAKNSGRTKVLGGND